MRTSSSDIKLCHNHQQLIDITFSSVQEEELHLFTDKFLTVSMIGYARYGFAKYDPNILKQIKHYTAHLSSHGYPTATVSCSGHCQMAGQSFRLHRLTVTAVFVNSFDQSCSWYSYAYLCVCSWPFLHEPGHSISCKIVCAPNEASN